MSNFEFKLDRAGVRSILRGDKIGNVCRELGEQVANRSEGLEVEITTKKGRNRVVTRVMTNTPESYYSNLKHNTLIKALRSIKL